MSDPQPKWRKVLISGSNAHVAALTASAIADTHGDAQSPGVEEQVLVYNTSSGAIYYTGSFGTGGGGSGTGNPAGNNHNIQFNNNGAFGGNDNFMFDDTGDTSLFVDGPITGSNISGSGIISGSSVVATSEVKLAKTSLPVGITQENVGGSATMEFTTTDSSDNQASRIVIRGNADTPDIEFYTGASGSELGNTSTSGLIAAFGGDNKNFAIGNLGTGSALATNTATSKFIVEGNITTTGSAGHITASGNISASNNIFVSTSLSGSHVNNNVVLVNTATGELYHTGSYGSGGSSVSTLQQVTDEGAVTTTAITSSTIKLVESGETFNPTLGGLLTLQYDDSTTNIINGMPSNADTHHLNLVNTNTTTDTYTAINFRSDNADGRIAYVQESTANTGHFSFITDNVGTSEVIRIEANGDFKVLDGDISASNKISAEKFEVEGLVFADKAGGKILLGEVGGVPTQIFGQGGIEMKNDLTGSIISASNNIFVSTSLSSSHTSNNVVLVNTATGELYHTGSYGSGGSGGGGVVTGYTNGSNNRVITSTGTTTINAEGGLLYDSTTETLTVATSNANSTTINGDDGTIRTTSNINVGNNSANTNVNNLISIAPKNGPSGYFAGYLVSTADTSVSNFSADGSHVGEFITVPSTANLTQFDIVFLRSTTSGWFNAIASSEGSGGKPILAMAVDSTTTNRAMVRGYIRVPASNILGSGITLGNNLFLSTGSSGHFQTEEPRGVTGHVVRRVGYVVQTVSGRSGISSAIVYFNPSNDYTVI